jgi:hypothetical protein
MVEGSRGGDEREEASSLAPPPSLRVPPPSISV